jgi:hypothetical protein
LAFRFVIVCCAPADPFHSLTGQVGCGDEDQFLPPRLSAGFGFRKETMAETRCGGRDAPYSGRNVFDREPPPARSAVG